MPSSATITSFFTFVANTKAKASQANTNFSNFRGTLVPIDPNTAAATDLTYDIGSDEHRWNAGYFGSIDLETSTSTASLVIKGETTVTTGAFIFQIEGVTKAVIDTNGITGSYLQPNSVDTTQLAPGSVGPNELSALAVRTANIEDANVTPAKLSAHQNQVSGVTTSAINATITTKIITATITSGNSRPHYMQLQGATTSSYVSLSSTITGSYELMWYRGAVQIGRYYGTYWSSANTGNTSTVQYISPTTFSFFDSNALTSGSVEYHLYAIVDTNTSTLTFNNVNLAVFQF